MCEEEMGLTLIYRYKLTADPQNKIPLKGLNIEASPASMYLGAL